MMWINAWFNGGQLQAHLESRGNNLPLVMMTAAHGQVRSAVQAMQRGDQIVWKS
ncbi:hypothetical protein [Granulibacter bethesdensis]|nr:hypothetical protein [Granulibacter bethesdensis]AHJ63539.1 Hypothetical protein GbCGDNIH3_7266 [Granulibacter bethesdensis]